MDFPQPKDLERAFDLIKSKIHKTPILTSNSLNDITNSHLFFKCENFQKTGSFKLRGATNTILNISIEQRKLGFATHSSGNHAQAVAYASKNVNTKSFIVMPKNASQVKINAVKSYGGEITFCENNDTSRKETLEKIVKQTQATFIPPFDHFDIICGQSTVALEILEKHKDLDFILCPVGGGGLSAGTCLAVEYFSPNTKVVLCEPENVDDTFQSLNAGKIIPNQSTNTLADGLKTTIGKLNFEIIKKYVHRVITVSEEEIIQSMKLLWERMKIVVEPSSAVTLAVVLKNKEMFKNKNVALILSGGNIDLEKLPF